MNPQNPPAPLPGFRPERMPLKWRLCFTTSVVGSAVYFGYHGDVVLAALITVIGLAASSGFRMGAIAIVASVVSLGAAIVYAPELGCQQEWRFTAWFGTTGLLNRLLAVGTVALILSALTTTAVLLLAGWVFRSRPRLDRANRWLGFGIGAAEGVLIASMLLGGVLVLEPLERQRIDRGVPQTDWGARLSGWILTAADHTRTSRVGPWVERYNPLIHVPQLNKLPEVQQSVLVLSDPEKIQKLLDHPDVQALRKRPEVQTAYDQLIADPRIRHALYSGERMTQTTAMLLLNHPAVLELIDQPGFVEAARETIRSTQLLITATGSAFDAAID